MWNDGGTTVVGREKEREQGLHNKIHIEHIRWTHGRDGLLYGLYSNDRCLTKARVAGACTCMCERRRVLVACVHVAETFLEHPGGHA